MKDDKAKRIFSASDVANYVVCPEAWRLKYFGLAKRKITEGNVVSSKQREQWSKQQDLSLTLRFYTKVAYALLVMLVIVVFLMDQRTYHRTNNPPALKTGVSR